MAYEPKVWECGDVVSAEALNHIEQGIAQSGGGTVEVIKIATMRGGGGAIGSNYAFGGGGSIDDGKSLYDLVGEKAIVDFAYVGHLQSDGTTMKDTPMAAGIILSEGTTGTEIDPRLASIEDRKLLKGGSIQAITQMQCSSIDIYAICI